MGLVMTATRVDATLKCELRVAQRSNWVNKFDPAYRLLDYMFFDLLFRPDSSDDGASVAEQSDIVFLTNNLRKHRAISWINISLLIYLVAHGLATISTGGDSTIIATGLLAPAVITGAAWYTVSFGGIPEKYIGAAIVLTFWMFLSFTLSMTLLTAVLCNICPWQISVFVICPIYLSLYMSSIFYDNIDGLKIGLDATLLKFSRASLNYYQKHGLITGDEASLDMYESTDTDSIALFTHYMNMLEKNLWQLEEGNKTLRGANHLIASSTDLVFRLIEIPSHQPIKRDADYETYIADAHAWTLDEVDEATIKYLKAAIRGLRQVLGNATSGNVDIAETTLLSFESLRQPPEEILSIENTSQADRLDQQFADHLFSQVFQQMSSLMKAHRHLFLRRRVQENLD